MKSNAILDTDSYKASHWLQYPPNTTGMYSYARLHCLHGRWRGRAGRALEEPGLFRVPRWRGVSVRRGAARRFLVFGRKVGDRFVRAGEVLDRAAVPGEARVLFSELEGRWDTSSTALRAAELARSTQKLEACSWR